ncbi:hypothetical protein [Mycoplasma sp. E35C]|uniref:hypothetical protein n=1 Tax=Mycoplasma sp. E35C TaxID=2801918 RepID=UPI001CA4645D|nr:hypothetical protein [Mycoplasma sp. E35C]QZX48966.1 hypothetical protein JJE79_02825 [Mycoplasma sp. E35C]
MNKYLDNDSISSYKYNPRGLKTIAFIGVISSLISIGFLVIGGEFSPGFKTFMNFIWYPFVGLGYCVSGIALGFNYYNNKHQSFKSWVYGHRRFFFYFYIIAFFVIITFLISLAILQKNNHNLVKLGILINTKHPDLGWTNNPNNWYGFIFLYTLIPLQNFNIIGTTFIVSLFWFNIFGFLLVNFLNKYGFKWNTLLLVILVMYCFFTHISDEIAKHNAWIKTNQPWMSEIKRFSAFINTVTLFYFGLYMRKYMRIWKFKYSVSLLTIITITFIIVQTILDFVWYKKFNLNFVLASGIASPGTILLSWLWVNSCVGFNLTNNKTQNRFINFSNNFINHVSAFSYPFWFQMAGISGRFIYGYLIINLLVGIPVKEAWYPRILLVFETKPYQNDYIFSFLIIFMMIIVPFIYYWLAKYLNILMLKIDNLVARKTNSKTV